ncbi:MAG: lipocalin family protein [Burkholderiaceae bacterium]
MTPSLPITSHIAMLLRWCVLLAAAALSAGCATGLPAGLTPVKGFELARYEGRWYEIARLDHRFERGLTDVTAQYRGQSDGTVEVVNRGWDARSNQWKEARGRAVFQGDPGTASLKVSFWGPFYGGYHVIALDTDYRWALVSGPNRDHLWILARERHIEPAVRERLLGQARQAGFAVDQLMWVSHLREMAP